MQEKSSESLRTVLSPIAINLLYRNKPIKQKIADACNTSYWAVHQWVKKNSAHLTQADSLRIIREETGLTDEQILTQEPAKA